MQTFLPYPDFRKCAEVLDYRRLGKQRVEAMQIIRCHHAMRTRGKRNIPWSNHPAVKMWYGYDIALAHYMNVMIQEWIKRGYNNNMKISPLPLFGPVVLPTWIGTEALHTSHRANLLRKNPDFYSQYGWKEEPQEGYWWPTVNIK